MIGIDTRKRLVFGSRSRLLKRQPEAGRHNRSIDRYFGDES